MSDGRVAVLVSSVFPDDNLLFPAGSRPPATLTCAPNDMILPSSGPPVPPAPGRPFRAGRPGPSRTSFFSARLSRLRFLKTKRRFLFLARKNPADWRPGFYGSLAGTMIWRRAVGRHGFEGRGLFLLSRRARRFSPRPGASAVFPLVGARSALASFSGALSTTVSLTPRTGCWPPGPVFGARSSRRAAGPRDGRRPGRLSRRRRRPSAGGSGRRRLFPPG